VRASAILPVKRFGAAKRRLGSIPDRDRARLIEAMLADVLGAITEAESVERVIVVTGERRADRLALRHAQRATTPIEVLRDPEDAGHREAATLGIIRSIALGAECAALLPGDCPLLEESELDDALARMRPGRVAVIPDRHGTGTNGLLLSPPDAIGPAFGPGSRERHVDLAERRGMEAAVEELASLALDLDTPDDLAELTAALGSEPERAAETARALANPPNVPESVTLRPSEGRSPDEGR
jgi:2-phospho-L-lactate guanylyltransferase